MLVLLLLTATVIHQQEENNIFQVHTDFGCKIQDFLRVSSRMVAQINRKIGKSGLRELVKIGNFVLKNRKINSTFLDKDRLPAPHQGYN